MLYKEYGRTGKKVSVLGFGTSRFTLEDCTVEERREKIIDLLVKANDFGINYFDTGEAYGGGKCEEVLGDAFERMKNPFYVSTKTLSPSFDADEIRRRLDQSLKRMKINKVNFYHMWCILNLDRFYLYMRKGGPYEGALKAKEEGLIDHICFSAHCNGEEIEKIIESGCFEGVLMGYNVINFKYREQGLMAAKKHGLGVGIMNPLGGGVLPNNPEYFSYLVENEDECVSEVALNFCMSQDPISVVLSGMTDEAQLMENLSAVSASKKMSLKRISYLKERTSQTLNKLCNGCRYCKGCPQGIETYRLMLSYNHYLLHDKDPRTFFEDLAQSWSFLPHEKFQCIECKACEQKCSQHINIAENIKVINAMIEQRQSNIDNGLMRCFGNREKEIIGIYAVGQYAKEMLNNYNEMYGKIDFEVFFFDSNPNKIGKESFLPSKVIYSPDDIERLGITRLIIASEDYFDEIYEKLKHHEKRGVKILKYTIKAQYRKLEDV